MKKMILTVRIVVLVAALSMPIRGALIYLGEAAAVNDCLDMGGSFDYETSICDFEKSHPYVPFSARHPGLLNVSAICLIVGMCLFAGTMLIRQREQEQNKNVELPQSLR